MTARLLDSFIYLLGLIQIVIFIQVLLSWIPNERFREINNFLGNITEPILSPIRKLLDKSSLGKNLMVDFSPVIALLVINFIKSFLTRSFHY